MSLFDSLKQAALMTAGMAWQTGWSLVLGFTDLGAAPGDVSADRPAAGASAGTARSEIALATPAGAASSSCSYASAAIMRTLFKKGAALAPRSPSWSPRPTSCSSSASILLVLLGWQFMLGQWIGGVGPDRDHEPRW